MIKLTVTEANTFRDIYEYIAIRIQRNKTQKMTRKLKKQIELLQKILKHCEPLEKEKDE